MSLRPIVISEGRHRESKVLTSNNSDFYLPTTQNASSANPKSIPRSSQIDGIKFVRKSELQPEFFERKSVISIKGDKHYEFRFAKNPISQMGISLCQTMPP
jgi:hypothetical protein